MGIQELIKMSKHLAMEIRLEDRKIKINFLITKTKQNRKKIYKTFLKKNKPKNKNHQKLLKAKNLKKKLVSPPLKLFYSSTHVQSSVSNR